MKKIFKYLLTFCGIVFLALAGIKFMPSQFQSNSEKELSIVSHDNEERPVQILSKEEKATNKRHIERYSKLKSSLKSTSGESSYANGEVQGTWDQVKFLASNKNSYGFRVDGSVYDQFNDVIYAISYAGHIYKINRQSDDYTKTEWESINHKYNFKLSYIEGLNKANGSFRMVRSSGTGMQYSDDEGKNWNFATGVQFSESTYEGAVGKTTGGNRIFVAGKTSASSIKTFLSVNDGESYSTLSQEFNPSNYTVKIFKPCNSESVFMLAFNKSTTKINVYECVVGDSDFKLLYTTSTNFTGLNSAFGTYYNEKFHFYIAGAKTHIYYSDDKGASWETKSSTNDGDGDIYPRTVHPTKPNVIFRGYLDVNVSSNYGSSFSTFSHYLGWDVHHMKMYQRKDLSYFHFVGKDFGCYISDTPESSKEYIQLNNTAPTQMCYDVEHGQNYYSSFTAAQDRGSMGYESATNESHTTDVKTTDGFRVTLANNEESIWTWMYYGTIYHQSNFVACKSGLAGINFTPNKWWAAPMIVSPNKKEDAVYLATGSSLTKLTYNPAKQSIIQTSHYFDFVKETGNNITGFGYSSINTDRWYVSVKNGIFLHSSDGGQTFEKSTYAGTAPKANDQTYNYHKNQHVIRASNIDEETVYYAGVGNVFLISKDGGITFTNHNNGLDVYRIRDFDFSEDEKFIYAACSSGGIWVYSVDSDQWFEMNDDAVPNVDFTDVEYIIKEGTVNFGTYGNGVLRFKVDGQNIEVQYPTNLTAEITIDKSVELKWDDLSNNEDGFMIERSSQGIFSEVTSVSANQISYTDTEELEAGLYSYRIKAFNSAGESHYSNYSLVEVKPAGEVSANGWELVSVDSEEINGYGAALSFDGDPSTMWHTQWSNSPIPTHPHTLVIDMHETLTLYGFSYLPRQDNQWNGTIAEYEFYVSIDNVNWTKESSGTWAKTANKKEIYFNNTIEARYLKLVALTDVIGSAFSSCAEFSVMTQQAVANLPKAPQFVQGGRLSDSEIELIWLDMSNDENGFVVEQLINGSFTPIYTSTSDVTSYILGNTVDSESYSFRVASFNNVGDSEYSDTMVIKSIGTAVVVGVEDKIWSEKSLKVYPNPFDNQLNVQLGTPGLFTDWKVLDTSGRLIKNGKISKNSTLETIMVDGLKPGLYVLSVGGENGWKSKKVIKK